MVDDALTFSAAGDLREIVEFGWKNYQEMTLCRPRFKPTVVIGFPCVLPMKGDARRSLAWPTTYCQHYCR
jgi:hypothetical protein